MFDQSADIDFVLDDSGTAAVIKQSGHADKPVRVVFDQNSTDQLGMLTDKPQVAIPDSDLVGVDLKTASITVTGKFPASRITKPLPDGSGWTTALLTRI